jgi:alcohol dehydrogenase
MSSATANWNYPTSVRFGAGRVAVLREACSTVGIERPLLVTDPGLREQPPVARALDALGGGTPVFSELKGNPVGKNVDDGVRAFADAGCDGVVAVGGGSALDVGKAIALMVGQGRPMWDFEDVGDNWTRVDADAVKPCIAVPTTAGTGSEVGRSSVITHEDEGRKIVIFHPTMLPVIALCDPELTVSLPAKLTAATGMDAFAHNLEALCAPGFHPLADGIAVEGLRLANDNLERAVSDPTDLDARGAMMASSLMGATAFQKGLGAIHALSHPVGVKLDAHHGLLNAIVMPYVLVHNEAAIAERISRLSAYLGLDDASPRGFLSRVLALREAIGIPHTLADIGVQPEHVDELSKMAAVDVTAGGNPVPVDEASLAGLYRKCIAGELPA